MAQNFKIPLSRNFPKSIFLFGVSRNVARTQGYGAITEHGAIALSNFAQFTLARMEIGPTESVLGRMHERLFAEMDAQEKFQPLPTEFAVWGNLNMKLPDFFYRIDDK